MLASLFASRSLAAVHDDLLFRATAGCAPLPRRQQLDHQLRDAGFTTTRWVQLMPLGSFHAVLAARYASRVPASTTRERKRQATRGSITRLEGV